jgi:hypothetical protein
MNIRLLLPSIISLFISSFIFSQTYESNKQSYFNKDSGEEIFVNGKSTLTIENNEFSVNLPNDFQLNGTLKFSSKKTTGTGFIQKVYKIDGGGLIAINEDNLFLNLGATHNTAYTLFLGNHIDPSEKEKKEKKERIEKAAEEFLYKSHTEIFGKLTADCIREGKVKPGMKEIAILLIKGQPLKINKTETSNSISNQYVYDKMYIYTVNRVVTTIQTEQ